MEQEQKIFPISLVMESMKDSGYKDAAHAVAELIDNSIQAGEDIDVPVDIELICLEETNFLNDRQSSRIIEIAVYDNATGMSPDILHKALAFGEGTRRGAKIGIGKFGMGLPNASISQCSKVDVWSWQNGSCFHSCLDISEIVKSGKDTLPIPTQSELPEAWKSRIKNQIGDSGTLIVWSSLDRLKWKRHRAFFSNTEFIVGRMYRYFLLDESCRIRMAAYNDAECLFDEYVKPNDPLYLMPNTNTPEPFTSVPGFKLYTEDDYYIQYNGEKHKVTVKFSIADHNFRKNYSEYYDDKNYANPGSTPFGKHCAKNLGISVIRSGRELELNNSFNIQYEPTERWWGAELRFDAALDEIFGVTNNKQAATAFKQITKEDIANEEDIKPSEVKKYLEAEGDSRYHILELSESIYSKLSAIRNEVKKQREGQNTKNEVTTNDAAERAASVTASKDGTKGLSDFKESTLSDEQKEQELRDDLERDGVSPDDEDMQAIIKSALEDDEKFIIGMSDMRGADVIFDVTQPAGKLKVTINESHLIYKHLIAELKESADSSYDIVKLLFASWALMEDREQNENNRDQLLEIRKEWGQYAKKMLNEYLNA
ncbi:ATP-binding protein [Sedimenticola selenatireducens]|uniref:ATP-binding protein n=1 Tax=Sedimenticola selenatireducens TaxID=191960 RepID=UPI002AAB9210|nr:ATP-binding protein [Sedimenticola selenatireducens]